MKSAKRLLIVAMGDDATAAYAHLIRQFGGDCYVAHTPEDIIGILTAAPLHGVVLDVPTAVRLKGPDKQRVVKLLDLYPILRLRYSSKEDAITALGAEPDASAALQAFLEGPCSSFSPRTIRRMERKSLRYNVILLLEYEDQREFAVVDNFTPLGCFIVTATSLPPGEGVTVVFPGAGKNGSHLQVNARVIHHNPWGSKRAFPGVGLAFDVDDDDDREALDRLYNV